MAARLMKKGADDNYATDYPEFLTEFLRMIDAVSADGYQTTFEDHSPSPNMLFASRRICSSRLRP